MFLTIYNIKADTLQYNDIRSRSPKVVWKDAIDAVGMPGPVDTKTGKNKITPKITKLDDILMFYKNSISRSVNKALCYALLFAKFTYFLEYKT